MPSRAHLDEFQRARDHPSTLDGAKVLLFGTTVVLCMLCSESMTTGSDGKRWVHLARTEKFSASCACKKPTTTTQKTCSI